MYTSVTDNSHRTAKGYLAAAAIIAAAAQIYGLFSHGVHSAFMTFAFIIPLIAGALPHLAAARLSKKEEGGAGDGLAAGLAGILASRGIKDAQLAVIATLTAGSLLKGALDIYGTTNRLLIAYPLLAAVLLIAAVVKFVKSNKNQKGSL